MFIWLPTAASKPTLTSNVSYQVLAVAPAEVQDHTTDQVNIVDCGLYGS